MAPAADAGPILCRAEGLCHAYAGRRAKGRRGGTEGVGPARGGGEGGGRRSGSEIGSGPPALRGVDLELRAGTLTAVVGANGSGKTTLLRILAGNLAPAGGRVSLFGVESPATATVAVRRRLLRRLSYLGQDLALDPEMSGLETLELLAVLYGLRGPRRVEIEAEIERFGLAEPVARPVAQWSGGQRRRLHLAGSLLVGADLLLADEPSAGLDRKGEERLWRLLESRAEGGAAVVVVSHDLARVARHAHRVVELEAGRITAQGPPAEVLAHGGLADEVPAAEAPPPEPAESSSAADEVGTSGCREEGSLPAAWPSPSRGRWRSGREA
ncbi:MAG: ABC transporter ATP-binding protein, partial [Holophagales bacterium]|nr:ABC transporter ATP-binding protein [Holophagales bacterium]